MLAGILLLPGCVTRPESRDAIVYLRDDAPEQDVEQLFGLVDRDRGVETCQCVMTNSSPAQDNPLRPGPGADGNPFFDQRLELTLRDDATAADASGLQQMIASSSQFERTVRRDEDGEWWYWQ